MKKLFFMMAVMLAGVLATTAQESTAPVKVDGGMIKGVVIDGVDTYLGIPFAAPPVGDLRWKEPQPCNHGRVCAFVTASHPRLCRT